MRTLLVVAGAVTLALLVSQPILRASRTCVARAKAIHAQVPLIDGHNDYPWALREIDPGRDFAKADITKSAPTLMTDIPRLRAGGVGGQFWSVYVPSTMPGSTAVTATLEQIEVVHRMTKKWPEVFELALTAEDVERSFRRGRIASMIGMEGGHSIDNSLATLRMMYALGARYMTLTHNNHTPWADSAAQAPVHGGLTRFGEEVVREMNWLGMLVDLSHVSPETMEDALRVSAAPVIFSHSSARAVTDVPRNVPDDILQQLPKNGGVVMVTFVPGFISDRRGRPRSRARPPSATGCARRWPTTRPGSGPPWRRGRRPTPSRGRRWPRWPTTSTTCARWPASTTSGWAATSTASPPCRSGLEDVSKYPALTIELLKRGYSDDDVKKVLGLNVLRVIRQVERVAAELQGKRGPSTATLQGLDGAK